MPDFTLANLMEMKDLAAGRGVELEARFARDALKSDHLGVSYFRYGSNVRSPIGHRHREQEEAYVVVSGSGRARIDDEIVDLKQWDVLRVAPTAVRSLEAGGDGLELIAIGSDRPEGGDGEMVEGFWAD